MKYKNLILHLIFSMIAVAILYNTFEPDKLLELIAKPLILPWIACYFLVNVSEKNHPVVKPALIAFFFCWLGDIALMFSGTVYFLSGLGFFLVAHLFYIRLYQKTDSGFSISLIRNHPAWLLPFAIYGAILLRILLPTVENGLIPAILFYTLALLAMAASALNRHNRVPSASFLLVLAGAVLFVASDSVIALRKFAFEIPHSGFWVMSTYLAAQYLIMLGLLRQVNFKAKSEQK